MKELIKQAKPILLLAITKDMIKCIESDDFEEYNESLKEDLRNQTNNEYHVVTIMADVASLKVLSGEDLTKEEKVKLIDSISK